MIPVLVLGGEANAIAIVRSLGRMGIPVHVSAEEDCLAFRSRYCADRFPYDQSQSSAEYWTRLLLDETPDHIRGSVVFACSDDAIAFIAEHYEALCKLFRIPEFVPDIQNAMLDKKRTLELAQRAGVPVPHFWDVRGTADLETIRHEVVFPVMIKPIHSHLFQRAFPGRKFLTADNFDELRQRTGEVAGKGLAAMVCEIIPGPDMLSSSYYTYIDARGEHLFHFTKRIFRRYPMNEGGATYHITEWLPETAELGQKFFHGIGFRGLGNVEFKRDPRDNTLKIIECNARFTGAQWLFVRAGIDIAYLIYCHVTGRPGPKIDKYREHVRLWYPLEDYWAFREQYGKGLLSPWDWLHSIMHWQAMPYFTIADPWPSLVVFSRVLRRKLGKMTRALWSRL